MTEKIRQLDTNTYIADDKRTLAQYLDTWFAEFYRANAKSRILSRLIAASSRIT